ncbi:hypothetical protein [Asaia sp. VD9]|uniref:hypothetical protein n=1 Tax=Asaia sp. VD9 TaxID=3081235 RepID=UPI0030171C32
MADLATPWRWGYGRLRESHKRTSAIAHINTDSVIPMLRWSGKVMDSMGVLLPHGLSHSRFWSVMLKDFSTYIFKDDLVLAHTD